MESVHINFSKVAKERHRLGISLWMLLASFLLTNTATFFTGQKELGIIFISVYIVCIVFVARLFNAMETTHAASYVLLIVIFPPAFFVAFIHALIKSSKMLKADALKA